MNDANESSLLRSIPAVDRALTQPAIASLMGRYDEALIKRMVRRALEDLRKEIREGVAGEKECSLEAVSERVVRVLQRRVGPKLQTLINATGVIVHTNLGRAPLSQRVTARIAQAALSYSNLEYDLTRSIKKVVYGFQSLDAVFAGMVEPVNLTLVVTPSTLPESLQGVPEVVLDVANEISDESGGKLTLDHLNVDHYLCSIIGGDPHGPTIWSGI